MARHPEFKEGLTVKTQKKVEGVRIKQGLTLVDICPQPFFPPTATTIEQISPPPSFPSTARLFGSRH